MQLLICPGYHSPALTHAFVRCLRRDVSPRWLRVLPIGQAWGALPWLLHGNHGLRTKRGLQIIAFSAGVAAAYPLALAWHQRGGHGRFIAMDGWGMPLLGGLPVYRMSHDPWTHGTTYFPSPEESHGCFYAQPPVEHRFLWQSPQATIGLGTLDGQGQWMTALDFIVAVLKGAMNEGNDRS